MEARRERTEVLIFFFFFLIFIFCPGLWLLVHMSEYKATCLDPVVFVGLVEGSEAPFSLHGQCLHFAIEEIESLAQGGKVRPRGHYCSWLPFREVFGT